MRILKYLLILIAILLVAYLAVGFAVPKVQYGHTITVDKPIEESWAVAEDQSKYDQWLEGFKSMELLSGEWGTEGSTYKIVVNPGEGQEDFIMTETVISREEFDHVEMHFDSEVMDFEQTIRYSEADGKTTISTESYVMGKGMMMKSMFATMELLGGAFQTQEAKNMEALKVLINENTTDYYTVPESVEVVETVVDSVTAEGSN